MLLLFIYLLLLSPCLGFGQTFGFTSLIPISFSYTSVYLPLLLSTLLYTSYPLIILSLKTKN